ncbi:MAG: gfo/Idh/MocA family oxidoreductase [Ignavibacteriae bacterium]|nr:MAG: gfo/Idh/MocA family oxidoreductase [Ignavibacteriota bacterium]
MKPEYTMSRREFVASTTKAAAGAVLINQLPASLIASTGGNKRRLAMIGTGHRGSGMWGTSVVKDYGDYVEFVGLCDINPGRAETAKKMMGASCPTFTNFEEMILKTKPETVIVTTVDGTHHTFIAKALEMGCDVITEKPMTTDEKKLQLILDAQKKSKNKIIVAHNYRYTPTRAKIKELLMQGRIGRITSVDFHWYLNVYHGADYFRRWHRLRDCSGTLLNHKASHHFDLLNWWLESEPMSVHALGGLEFYGKNHEFRSTNCRPCPLKDKCQFYWDMTKDKRLMALYADNEKYDGYLRDGCVWKEDIDIFDKMAVQILYANKVQVSYSLTTYSPYEGYRIAFNGTKGRLDHWMHEKQPWPTDPYDEIQVTDNFGQAEFIRIPTIEGNHGGADPLMKDKIFKDPTLPDPLRQAANVRDGAMAVLIGVAARHSIDSGKPVAISDLTDLVPQAVKPE